MGQETVEIEYKAVINCCNDVHVLLIVLKSLNDL